MYFPSFFKILLALLALPFKSGALLAFSSAPLLLLHAEMRPLLFPPFAVPSAVPPAAPPLATGQPQGLAASSS
jgi:hypothetical protein